MNNQTSTPAPEPEQALDPALPICDPHHHLWDYPNSRYLVAELLDDLAGGHRVTETIYVECRHGWRKDGPEALRPVGETEYVARLTVDYQGGDETRVAAGIVAFADLTLGAKVRAVLEAQLAVSARVRGIRYLSAWDPSETIHNSQTNPPEHLLLDRQFREGFALLSDFDLVFDAWVYHPQIPDVIELARAFPDQPIVLNHVGGPLGIGPYAGRREEIFAGWHRDIADLARCSNVSVKLGGLAMSMSGFGWHKRDIPPASAELAEAMAPYFKTCIEHLGTERCMFESNWPIDKVSCSYTVLWNAFKRVAADYSDAERAALLHDTAVRTYHL
jgi:predicted TIM-barrel fold metal-dependent hydrolase